MTPREIIEANISYSGIDEIGLVFTLGENRISDFAGTSCKDRIRLEEWEEGDMLYYTDLWGNLWHRFKHLSKSGEVFRPVIETWDAMDKLELPDLDNPDYFEHARQLGREESDKYRVGFMPGWPFATCRYMRKMEQYFVDILTERDRIDVLHERVTALLERVIDRFGEAGLDAIMFCEDLGIQDRLLMGPETWRDIFRPLYEQLTAAAHRWGMKVIQHSCGYNWDLVDDLCGAGIDCLQFDQPKVYDMEALAAKLRSHGVGLYSPCDIQQVLPTGDRHLIEEETRLLTETFRGGFIAKNYGDLNGIGVDPVWDEWAYQAFLGASNRVPVAQTTG